MCSRRANPRTMLLGLLIWPNYFYQCTLVTGTVMVCRITLLSSEDFPAFHLFYPVWHREFTCKFRCDHLHTVSPSICKVRKPWVQKSWGQKSQDLAEQKWIWLKSNPKKSRSLDFSSGEWAFWPHVAPSSREQGEIYKLAFQEIKVSVTHQTMLTIVTNKVIYMVTR